MRDTQHMNKAHDIAAHTDAGHEVLVKSGVVFCQSCTVALDSSGSRPGLIEANQYR